MAAAGHVVNRVEQLLIGARRRTYRAAACRRTAYLRSYAEARLLALRETRRPCLPRCRWRRATDAGRMAREADSADTSVRPVPVRFVGAGELPHRRSRHQQAVRRSTRNASNIVESSDCFRLRLSEAGTGSLRLACNVASSFAEAETQQLQFGCAAVEHRDGNRSDALFDGQCDARDRRRFRSISAVVEQLEVGAATRRDPEPRAFEHSTGTDRVCLIERAERRPCSGTTAM